MDLKSKVVLLTGANGGIGQKIAEQLLASDVAKIYAGARKVESLEDVVALDPERIVPVQVDICDQKSVDKLAKTCPDVDILINNSGVNLGNYVTAVDGLESAQKEMEVNYFGTFRMCRAFTPQLVEKGKGVIVNICSLLSFVSMPANGTYCASKAALFSYTQSLKGELGPKGISVIGVYPGPVDTRMTASLDVPKITPEQVAKEIVEGIVKDTYRILPGDEAKDTYNALIQDYEKVEETFSYIIPS